MRLLLHAAVVSFDIRKIFGWSSLWTETWCCGFEMKREPWHSYVFENQLQEVNHLLATFRPCRDNSYRFEVSWKPQDLHETVWKLQTHIMNHHICFRYETVSLARLPVSPKGYLRSLDLVTSKNASKDSLTWVIVFLVNWILCKRAWDGAECLHKHDETSHRFCFRTWNIPCCQFAVSPEGYLRSFDHVKSTCTSKKKKIEKIKFDDPLQCFANFQDCFRTGRKLKIHWRYKKSKKKWREFSYRQRQIQGQQISDFENICWLTIIRAKYLLINNYYHQIIVDWQLSWILKSE